MLVSMRARQYLFYIALLLLGGQTYAGDSKTISFASADGLLISADTYTPHPHKTTPLIVLFHQAGWSRGEYSEIAPRLNTLGYNCMAVDLRSGEYVMGKDNETAKRAVESGVDTNYIDALPDIISALQYARKHYGTDKLIAWGSSYSAALVLQIAGTHNDLVDGVIAFSPGEYFSRAGKSETWIQDSATSIAAPVFITSSRNEADTWRGIYGAIKTDNKTRFVPESDGKHGSRALWNKYTDSAAYWQAVSGFLRQYFPSLAAKNPNES